MELPHIGQHCSDSFCKQLDYLPMKCDACSKLFCTDHLPYDDHKCNSLYKKNIQVPVCPLCNTPIPVPRGTVPDLAVSAHIEQNCQKKSKEKVFNNKCNKPKCKKKELIACICNGCHLNFCLTHRHTADHDCKGPQKSVQPASKAAAAAAARSAGASSSGQSKITNFFTGPFRTEHPRQQQPSPAAAAALNRQNGRGSTPGRPCLVPANPNAGMSEDEALAAALAASMGDASLESSGAASSSNLTSQEEEDRMLAQALQESERLARQQGQSQATGGDRDKSCTLQ
eukprot:GFUD01029373.1.p1 GENE.GFUD01029373.1~~GFUD01029373.1.p1  ORF type:complete len:285 (+),score=84.37 GFUD01029373.1:343-1197(+)